MFYSENIGKSLTLYKHKSYNRLIHSFYKFLTVNQHEEQPKILDDVKKLGNYSYTIKDDAICGNGQYLYGVGDDDRLFLIKYIIDSSD
jgi:hypothetical protein